MNGPGSPLISPDYIWIPGFPKKQEGRAVTLEHRQLQHARAGKKFCLPPYLGRGTPVVTTSEICTYITKQLFSSGDNKYLR